MSHLPHENRNVRGYDGPYYDMEPVCVHPFCDVTGRENLEIHHLWPRSFLRNQTLSWVQLWDGTIVGNQVYLCNAFQNGHHQAITENKAEIFWTGRKFGWQGEDFAAPLSVQPPLYGSEKAPNAKYPLYGERDASGALNVLDGLTERSTTCSKCKGTGKEPPKEKKKREPAKKRQTLSIRCPKEREEDGVELIVDMLAQGEEILRPGEKARPMYFTLADMLGLFLLNHKEILE